jgi:hypothetical protein
MGDEARTWANIMEESHGRIAVKASQSVIFYTTSKKIDKRGIKKTSPQQEKQTINSRRKIHDYTKTASLPCALFSNRFLFETNVQK